MPQICSDYVAMYAFHRRAEGCEILLLRRCPEDEYLPCTWQPVYGEILSGETAWHAAVRELREETGLTPLALYAVNTVVSFYMASRDTIYHCANFAAEVGPGAGVTLSAEHDDYAWLAPEVMLGRLMWPGQRLVVQEIVSEIITPAAAAPYLRISIE